MKPTFLNGVVLGAVVSAVVSGGVALATTQNFVLGGPNVVDAPSSVSNANGGTVNAVDAALVTLENLSTGSGATALSLNVPNGKPPLVVNSDAKVVKLNADRLDGKDSSGFLGATAKAVDSDLLDGKDSTAFLPANGKAINADLLDGADSGDFVRKTEKAPNADKLDFLDSTQFQLRCSRGAMEAFAMIDGARLASSFTTNGNVHIFVCGVQSPNVTAKRVASGRDVVCFADLPNENSHLPVGNAVGSGADPGTDDLFSYEQSLDAGCPGLQYKVQTVDQGVSGFEDSTFSIAVF